MKKTVACKKCGHQIELTTADMGKTIKCPGCSYQFVVRTGKAATLQGQTSVEGTSTPALGSPAAPLVPQALADDDDEYKLAAPVTETAEIARLREAQRRDVQQIQDRVEDRERTLYNVVHEASPTSLKAEKISNWFLLTLYPAVVFVLFLRLIGLQEYHIVESIILFPPVIIGIVAGVMYWVGLHEPV